MNQRDLELLSTYLDGELNPADSTKLEARLKTDRELASVLNDLRATRTLLRKLPSRKAPRNFTLTRKMVGQNPPLPHSYTIFRTTTAMATLLFFLSFGLNFLGTQFVGAPTMAYGMGGGGGGAEVFSAPAATEAPAMTEAPMMQAPSIEQATQEAPLALAPVPTQEDTSRMMEETPVMKNGAPLNSTQADEQPMVAASEPSQASSPVPLISSMWQIVMAVVAVLGAALMILTRQLAARRWK